MRAPPDLNDPNPLAHDAALDAQRMLEKAQHEFAIRYPRRVAEYLERLRALRNDIAASRGQYYNLMVAGTTVHTIQERDPEYIARRMVLIATLIQEEESRGERYTAG